MPDFDQSEAINATMGGGGGETIAAIPWGTFDDPDSPLRQPVPIPPGFLDCLRTALDRLWKQYEGRDNWVRAFTAIAESFCQVVDQQGQIARGIHLANASGVQLDHIGAAVGLPRQGLGDDLYRLAIRARAMSLLASGTGNEILDLIEALFPGAGGTLEEWFPATLKICVPGLSAEQFALLLRILAPVPAAGVGAVLDTFDPGSGAGWGYFDPGDVIPVGSWGYPGASADDLAGIFAPWSYSATIGP